LSDYNDQVSKIYSSPRINFVFVMSAGCRILVQFSHSCWVSVFLGLGGITRHEKVRRAVQPWDVLSAWQLHNCSQAAATCLLDSTIVVFLTFLDSAASHSEASIASFAICAADLE